MSMPDDHAPRPRFATASPAVTGPRPRLTLTSNMEIGSQDVTAITRVWHPGDASRCRRCPVGRCSAHRDVCQVLVNRHVAPEQAPEYVATDEGWVTHGRSPLFGEG